MKICVFGDVHGNFKQLKKLTETADFLSADLRICLGDVVGLGPYSKECMDLLENFSYIYLIGNHESRMIGKICDFTPEKDFKLYQQYEINKVKLAQYLDKFESLPINYDMVLAGKKVRFTHYGWYEGNMSNKQVAVKDKNLLVQFGLKEKEFDYVIYGHIHSPSEKIEGGITFFDIGSLGLKCPSNYLMIDDSNGLTLTRKTIDYDLNEFFSECEKLNYPRWELLKIFSFDNLIEKRS